MSGWKKFSLFGFIGVLLVLLCVGACGGDQEGGTATPSSPTPLPTPAREVIYSGEPAGLPAKVEHLIQTDEYVVTIVAPTADRWRDGKRELEKLLPSLVPDPCRVHWSPSILLRDELGPEDLQTAGCR